MSLINMNEKLIKMIKVNEGLRLEVYKCTAGHKTIGYGRNLDRSGGGISEQEAQYLLENDVAAVEHYCQKEFSFWDTLDVVRQSVLIDMAFNLGIFGLLKFKNMLKAIAAKDWDEAGEQLMDSSYAAQVHGRAKRNKIMLMTGLWPKHER